MQLSDRGSKCGPASDSDGNNVASLLESIDFENTSLGGSRDWDRSLSSVLALMLDSHFPMFVAWGDELRFFYNDAYSEILGDKHPNAFGARFEDVWVEIWDDILPLIEKALAGIATYSEDLPLLMNRRGYDEHSWFTFSYSPVRDEHGFVRGMFCAVTETTERVLLERRQSFHLSLEERLRQINNPAEVMAAAAEALGRELDIARVGYGEIDETEEHVIVERDWTDGRIPSVAGTYRMNDFGAPIIEELKRGRVMFVDDVDDDPRVGTMAAAFRAIGSRTVLAVPLNKEGRFKAMLFLHHPRPHRWTESHIALATEVAERTWSAVERAKAEADKARSTARLHFLDAVGKATSVMTDADTILETTTQMLGEHLGVSVCAYADMDEDEDGFTIRGDWAAPGATHITGRYRLKDFGRLAVTELSSARPLIINDNLSEIAPDEAATFQSIGIAATICMPLVKAGRLTALMAVHHTVPHKWSAAELALVREVTDRSWAHVERVRTEAELLASQENLRQANENLEATVAERTAELMVAEESLRQAQKMEAVGQLTGGLAHDFNNLLAGVIGSLEVMKTRVAQGRFGELDRYLNAASGAAQRGAALTQRMLAFSRRQTLDPRPADVDELINSMVELIRGSVGPAIVVDIAFTDELWPTSVDVGQLENSLLNLCINARDAMPDGGRITIQTANRSMSGRHALTLGLKPGQYISICVADTGTGMSSETAARAFDPFFTTKPTGQGTGLGLSMVWGFAGQSGGSVRIQTEPGRGTTVCIYLPRYLGEIVAADVVDQEKLTQPSQGPTMILLVDDEPLVRMLAAEHLEDLGCRVIQAGDANEALNAWRASPEIDVLVTDVGLPNGMNGRQLADALRVENPNLPILFITGYAENAVLNHGHLEQGMQVLTKPFNMDVFAERVRMLSASLKA
jgi:signal transduction histidine kinase/ActR/RegA family two-component response regulator